MNLVYLILAFKQPRQIMRLVDRLDQPHVHFYIHYDKKSADLPLLRDCVSKYNNVKIISTTKVYWGGYSQLQAELDMLHAAYNSETDFKYYLLLSGQDYPIKDNNYINNFFESNTCDFLVFHDLKFASIDFLNKFRYYHFYDVPYINPKSPEKIPFLSYLYFGGHKFLRKILPGRRIYKNMTPYFGSTKTALTKETVQYIIDFLKNNPGFIQFMKYTETPDETFFQTILLNSDRKTNVYNYDKYREWLKTRKENELFPGTEYASLRYKDWSERGKPKPAILDESYFDILKESDMLFARKFDEKESAGLLDMLDREILRKPEWTPQR
jgi:hypothetical protein